MKKQPYERRPVLHVRLDEVLHERVRALAWHGHQSMASWTLGRLRSALTHPMTLARVQEYREAGSPELGRGSAARHRKAKV